MTSILFFNKNFKEIIEYCRIQATATHCYTKRRIDFKDLNIFKRCNFIFRIFLLSLGSYCFGLVNRTLISRFAVTLSAWSYHRRNYYFLKNYMKREIFPSNVNYNSLFCKAFTLKKDQINMLDSRLYQPATSYECAFTASINDKALVEMIDKLIQFVYTKPAIIKNIQSICGRDKVIYSITQAFLCEIQCCVSFIEYSQNCTPTISPEVFGSYMNPCLTEGAYNLMQIWAKNPQVSFLSDQTGSMKTRYYNSLTSADLPHLFRCFDLDISKDGCDFSGLDGYISLPYNSSAVFSVLSEHCQDFLYMPRILRSTNNLPLPIGDYAVHTEGGQVDESWCLERGEIIPKLNVSFGSFYKVQVAGSLDVGGLDVYGRMKTDVYYHDHGINFLYIYTGLIFGSNNRLDVGYVGDEDYPSFDSGPSVFPNSNGGWVPPSNDLDRPKTNKPKPRANTNNGKSFNDAKNMVGKVYDNPIGKVIIDSAVAGATSALAGKTIMGNSIPDLLRIPEVRRIANSRNLKNFL